MLHDYALHKGNMLSQPAPMNAFSRLLVSLSALIVALSFGWMAYAVSQMSAHGIYLNLGGQGRTLGNEISVGVGLGGSTELKHSGDVRLSHSGDLSLYRY